MSCYSILCIHLHPIISYYESMYVSLLIHEYPVFLPFCVQGGKPLFLFPSPQPAPGAATTVPLASSCNGSGSPSVAAVVPAPVMCCAGVGYRLASSGAGSGPPPVGGQYQQCRWFPSCSALASDICGPAAAPAPARPSQQRRRLRALAGASRFQ
jgi:hypothetical protein